MSAPMDLAGQEKHFAEVPASKRFLQMEGIGGEELLCCSGEPVGVEAWEGEPFGRFLEPVRPVSQAEEVDRAAGAVICL